MRDAGRLARFVNVTAEPDRTVGLSANHPAVTEGRTLFPGTVVGAMNSPRFLVSAVNSAKIGKQIEKGPWSGMPVFTLTLEERKTCPTSCHVWKECYGNAMHLARRNDAFDPDFMPALKAELVTLVREQCAPRRSHRNWTPPLGVVIRLHILGDFFSVGYVQVWRSVLQALPEVHVFGYTARHLDAEDEESRLIAAEIQVLNDAYPDRWVIRYSHTEPGAGRTIVVDSASDHPDVIMCPAQTKKTEACSTCAICWSPAAWEKTIGFLRHGIKRPVVRKSRDKGGRRSGKNVVRNGYGLIPSTAKVHAAMLRLADERGVVARTVAEIAREAGVSVGVWQVHTGAMFAAKLLRVLRPRIGPSGMIWQVFAEPQEDFSPPPLLPAPARAARPVGKLRDPIPKNDARPVVRRLPEQPLVKFVPHTVKAKYHPRTGTPLNPGAIGSADQFDIGTAEERVAALAEDDRRRIAEAYGVTFREKEPG